MKHKLIMIWQLLRSKDWIVVADKTTHINASGYTVTRTIHLLGSSLVHEVIKVEQKMDSAVEEVNNIINGKV
jgi:hypothetical protein